MLRILTYNVHSCIGSDRKSDPARIAEVIAGCQADIIALQELDVGRARTGGIDQAHAIAAHLDMRAHFHPSLHLEEELYGDAILTALPSDLVKAGPLPSIGEPRGAIWVSVHVGGVDLQVLNTHLGLSRRERRDQVVALLGPDWLGNPSCRSPRILVGDFNAMPGSAAYRLLASRMKDFHVDLLPRRPRPTFPARLPLLRIDHIFLDDFIEVLDGGVHRGRVAGTASDHLPLIADIRLPGARPADVR
ncbi:MAG TPA: endonuclease/exonuclease/phosphatase family protein [Rhizobiaceae bacterium]|nr:endonuclease/exonuclease/phosphatase family protein [Rhizobiaceae bacterium]